MQRCKCYFQVELKYLSTSTKKYSYRTAIGLIIAFIDDTIQQNVDLWFDVRLSMSYVTGCNKNRSIFCVFLILQKYIVCIKPFRFLRLRPWVEVS